MPLVFDDRPRPCVVSHYRWLSPLGSSGLKSFRSAADETVDSNFVDALLKKTVNSPMKVGRPRCRY